jgi:hypothetical protein
MRASARTPMSARTRPCVLADGFLPHPRTVKPVREVNADAGGRPDGNFHPKTFVMTSLHRRKPVCPPYKHSVV